MNKFLVRLPNFSGFYGYEDLFDVDMDIEYIETEYPSLYEQIESRGLSNQLWSALDACIDYKKTYEKIAKELVNSVYKCEVFSFGFEDIVFESLVSPREYNFKTDEIFAVIHLTNAQLSDIEKHCFETKQTEFDKFLRDNYTSYSGFWSFMENDIDSFKEAYFCDKSEDILNGDSNSLYFEVILEFLYNYAETNVSPMFIESINEFIEYNVGMYDMEAITKKVLEEN